MSNPVVFVETGGEPYVKWAKSKLSQLSAIRESLRLPVMKKTYTPQDGVMINLRASEFGDQIRISASLLRYLFSSDITPSIEIDTVVIVNTVTDYFANVTASILFSDGTKVAIPGGSGTISAHVYDSPINNRVTWTNAPVAGAMPILTVKNGSADAVTDTTTLTNIDESLFIASVASPISTVGDVAPSFLSAAFVSGHPTFSPAPPSVVADGELMTVARLEYVYGPPLTFSCSIIVSGTFWSGSTTYSWTISDPGGVVASGTGSMVSTFSGTLDPVTHNPSSDGHHVVTYTRAILDRGNPMETNGTAGGDIIGGVNTNPFTSTTANVLPEWIAAVGATHQSSFPPVGASISKVSLVGAKKYKYTAATTSPVAPAKWEFVAVVKLYDLVNPSTGIVDRVNGVRTEVTHVDHDTTLNYGDIIFISEKPLVHKGTTKKELETTYTAQMALLKPLAVFDILKFVHDALFTS